MESWNVLASRDSDADFFLLNRTRTAIKVNARSGFEIAKLLAALEEVEFPLEFTEGILLINFRYIKPTLYGMYGNNEVDIDVRQSRQFKTILATFVHEVAHHVDSEEDFSCLLTDERKKKGKLIHRIAGQDDSEYWARGFEKFYSQDKKERQNLRENCPKLYRMLLKLHRNFKAK